MKDYTKKLTFFIYPENTYKKFTINLKDAFTAIFTTSSSEDCRCLKDRIETYQSVLCEEDSPEKDFICRIDEHNNQQLTVTGNLKTLFICLRHSEMMSPQQEERFKSEVEIKIQQAILYKGKQNILSIYEKNAHLADEVFCSSQTKWESK